MSAATARKIEPAPFVPPEVERGELISSDELRRRLAEAPIDDEPETPEEAAAVAAALANPRTFTTDEVLRDLGLAP